MIELSTIFAEVAEKWWMAIALMPAVGSIGYIVHRQIKDEKEGPAPRGPEPK